MHYSPARRILYINGNRQDGGASAATLRHFEDGAYSVSTAATPGEALELIASEPFDLFILEHSHSEMSGVELCRRIRQTDRQTPILFFAGRTRAAEGDVSLAAGATEYLTEPVSGEYLIESVRRLLKDFHAAKPNHQSACCLTK